MVLSGAGVDPPATVMTEGGVVTMIDLPGLRSRVADLHKRADSLTEQSRSLQTLAQNLWIQRGKLLITNSTGWITPLPLAEVVGQARALNETEATDEARLQSIQAEDHHGVAGIIGKVGGWNESRNISAERAKVDSQLHPLLMRIGQEAPPVTVPEADLVRTEAIAAEDQAKQLESEAVGIAATAATTDEEIHRRGDAQSAMGFDAPYLAATLTTQGPQSVQSPLIPRKGEEACLAVPATLARNQTRRQWVGASQGFSFPIGHTGIRYRVGSFRGHPVEQQLLTKLDAGTLVVSNQRLAFIGSTKSTAVAYAKLLHVECYSDALAVFQEGREKPDFYYVDKPQYVLFFVNWFLNQTA
ncbi:MAG TPA: hypothetical protein VNU19_12510 [Candidatus Acidoferrum sp.]|jgi:hypothetical protein|nr:hypothetical protein [Candidatus Acidoferrum sp.]